jgi:internalin A
MKRLLICLLLVGVLGCGKEEHTETEATALFYLQDLGAKFAKAKGSVFSLSLVDSPVTDADLVHLKALAKLRILRLENVQVTDAGLANLEGLTNLEALLLYNTQVTDQAATNLQKSLPNCRITVEADMPQERDAISALKKMGASIVKNKSGKTIKVELPHFHNRLRNIDTVAAFEHLKELPSLTTLDLTYKLGPYIDDADLHHLKKTPNLNALLIAGSKITDDGLERLQVLTELSSLDLALTSVSDSGLEHLAGLTKLQKLILYNTKITDAGIIFLKRLTSLRELYIGGTKVTQASTTELQKELPNCKISRTSPY